MTTQSVFDELLVLQYQSGDIKALDLLVKRYHTKLCRHAFWYIKDLDVAKDVVQEAWSVIIDKMGGLRDPKAFESWAMCIVTRKSLDHLKYKQRHRDRLYRPQLSAESDLDTNDRESDLAKLNQAMQLLPFDQLTVLRLFYIEAYSLKEIGAILKISTGTVKSRLFHAREKLKTILKTKP